VDLKLVSYQLKLKIVVLHDDHNEEIHMIHLVGFIATDLVSVDG